MCQYLTPEQFGFVLALFITASSLPSDSLATILSLHAPRPTPHAALRWDQQGQVMRKPSPAGYCLPPTAELPIGRTRPDLDERPSILVCHRTRRFLQKIRSVPRPLVPPNR